MTLNQDFGNRRRQIIPSARRGIHCQDRSADASVMARYGDDNSSDEEPQRSSDGVDEVDNVMSKFSHTSSPLAMRRRNSMTPPNVQYTDDSDEHGVLAKSLPATLPSRSYYSDDFDVWRTPIQHIHKSGSVSPPPLGNRSNDSRNSSFSSRSPNISHRINQSTREREQESSGNVTKFLFGLLTILCAAYYYQFFSSSNQQDRYDEMKFRRDLHELGAKYRVTDDSILQLQAGISTIFEREDTSCFIFLYNSQKKDYNPGKFYGFVDHVVSNTAKFLRNDTTPSKHRVVDGADLDMGSHSQLVCAYQEDIAKTGVLLVKDVALVPSPLAMAFHYYCDEYQPLVRKSAIFFTLNTAKCHNSGETSSHASAERCLKEKWNTVPKDNIGPLLTRVANVVVDVTTV
ncbi:uncharacterized protein LOC125241891 isoform X2 [Leguminivora glycinivorella]|uniref:uncharacterized protein LOC125241891 isoform X2 n=1 Tax=Leguminivora glycinivorella TaxID=1035111 RepID=UPI00200DE9E2|nr:uncharacterized protein LOC125241891 isoform X2 [Leguminivora glycinivorella]